MTKFVQCIVTALLNSNLASLMNQKLNAYCTIAWDLTANFAVTIEICLSLRRLSPSPSRLDSSLATAVQARLRGIRVGTSRLSRALSFHVEFRPIPVHVELCRKSVDRYCTN